MAATAIMARRRAFVLASATAGMLASSHWAGAASYTYNGATYGTWTVTGNWLSTGSTYPGTSGDAAIINGVSGSNQTVLYPIASGVTAGLGTLSLTQTFPSVNEVDYQPTGTATLSIANSVTLAASNGGTSQLFLDPVDTNGTRTSYLVVPQITLNAGGVLELGLSKSVALAAQDESTVAGNILIAGGTLYSDLGEGDSVGTDSLANTINGSITMSSGTISIGLNGPNGYAKTLVGATGQGPQTNDRLNVSGNVTITGGTLVSANAAEVFTLSGATNTITGLSNGTITTSFTLGSTTTYTAASPQIFLTDSAIPALVQFRQTAAGSGVLVGAINSYIEFGSYTSTKTLYTGQLEFQNESTFGTQTLQLRSNVTSSGNLTQSGNHASVTDTLDLNGYTLDVSNSQATQVIPGQNTGSFLIMNSGGAGSIGTMRAAAYNLAISGEPTVSIGSYVNLVATGVGATGTSTLSAYTGGTIDPTSTFTYSPTATGVGSLISNRTIGNLVITAGTLNLGSAITTGSTSAVTVSAGTLNLNTYALTAGSLSMSGGTINLDGSAATIGDLTGTGGVIYNSVSGADALTVGNANGGGGSFSGLIENNLSSGGSISLSKIGTGTIALGGANKYTGGTTVTAGTLVADVSNAGSTTGAFGPSTSSLSLGTATGTLNAAVLTGGAFTVSNPIFAVSGDTGALTVGGGADANSTFSGTIFLNNNLTLSQVTSAGTNALAITGGIVGNTPGAKTVTFAGPGNIGINTGTLSDGLGTVSVAATGGTTTFGVANNYSGGTTVSGGTLTDSAAGIAGAYGSGNVTVAPTGTLSTQSAELIANSNTAIASTAAVTVNDNAAANGTVVFNGSAPTIASLSGTGNVALTGSSGTALTTGTAGNPTFSGVISDSGGSLSNGSLTVTGSGSFTLAGTSTYFGSTNVSGGTLNITGALANSATVNVNNASNLVLAGATALPASATVNVGSLASAYVNNAQTITSLASAGNATFSAGTSIVGIGNGVGTGTGTTGFTAGGVTGTGNLTVNGSANLYAATISQNLLNIGTVSTVTIADSSAPGNTAATSVLTDINNSGTLDLKNNDLIVLDTTQYTTVRNLINNAADGGAWDMSGITSSSAKANSSVYGLGYAQASTLGSTSFDGQTFADAVLVKYTLLGDTQLRGQVGIGDYDTVLSNFGTVQDWSGGNFHYGGTVGIGDYDDVLSNFGAPLTGNVTAGPALARGLSPALSLSPSYAKADIKLEVNTVTGDVYALANTSIAFTGYTVADPSAHLIDGGSPDTAKLLSVAPQSGGNTNVYETAGTYVNWFKISEVATQVAEGQNNNGFANHSSRDDTINIPSGGTIDFGDIYNTAGGVQDITFNFAEAGSTPTNGPAYYGAEVDYIGGSVITPEPGSMSLLAIGAAGMLARRKRRGA